MKSDLYILKENETKRSWKCVFPSIIPFSVFFSVFFQFLISPKFCSVKNPETWLGKSLTIFPDAGEDQAGVYEISTDRNSRSTLNKGYMIKQLARSRVWPENGQETIRASMNEENISLTVQKFRNDNIGTVKWFKFDQQRFVEVEVRETSNVKIRTNPENSLKFKKITTRDSGIYRASINTE